MQVHDFFQIKENADAYQAWVKDPVTKAVLSMVTEAARPRGMLKPNSEEALYLHGMAVGMSVLIDVLCHLEKVDPDSPAYRAAQVDLEATYGAEAQLRREGYTVPEKVK